jgi:hypothetical protein
MAYDNEPRGWKTPASEDPENPKNPPNSLLRLETRRRALLSYVLPVVVLFVIVGIALVYWMVRPATPGGDREEYAVGTVGRGPGGFDPAPEPGDTKDEVEFRGVGDTTGRITPDIDRNETLTSVAHVLGTTERGRHVELEDVEVVSADSGALLVRDGETRVTISTTHGAPAVKPGARVDVVGITERGTDGVMVVRASDVREHE